MGGWQNRLVTDEEIIAFVTRLPDVDLLTASRESGAPESAWGDSFFYARPGGQASDPTKQMPFATIVCSDYEGFDTASDLNRTDVFRLNISVGRRAFTEVIGYGPATFASHAGEYDFAVLDTLMPHPVYAAQGWVSILNPVVLADQARELLAAARDRDAARAAR